MIVGHDHALQGPSGAERLVMVFGPLPGPGDGGRGAAQAAGFDNVHDRIAPEGRPGHAGDRQEQNAPPDIDAGQGVQVAPEGTASGIGRSERDGGDCPPARPPQIEARGEQDDGPARHDLHQDVERPTQQGQAVGLLDQLHETADGNHAGGAACVRIDEDRLLHPVGPIHPQADGLVRPGGHDQIGDPAAAGGLRRRRQPGFRGRLGLHRRHADHVAIEGAVDLVLEQIQAAGQGQQHQHGHDEDAGVEMPAPDGAVGAGQIVRRLGCGLPGHQ
jgi:hypothetical protein